jgi:hypothetical protein
MLDPNSKIERVRGYELRGGGEWLGNARNWLLWHKDPHGRLTWGSDDEVRMTVKEIEELASEAAAGAINEERERVALKAQRDRVRQKTYKDDEIKTLCERMQGLIVDKQPGHASWHMAIMDVVKELHMALGQRLVTEPTKEST